VYGKLAAFFRGKAAGEPVFGVRPHGAFERANAALARRVKVDATELKRENITFYSGRHYWKTLMSAGGLGEDAEEIFMGHKVTGDIAKLYNHRDKRGWELMVKKAEQVFTILDKSILEGKSS
jgi:integrase